MKKIVFFCLLLIISATSFSQEKKKLLSFGLKFGYCRSSVSPDYTDSSWYHYSFKMGGGPIAGCFLQMVVGKKIVFQPEVLFVYRKTHESVKHIASPDDPRPIGIIKRIFFELPLNLLAKLPTKSGFFTIGGGPAPAIIKKIRDEGRIFEIGDVSKKFKLGFNLLLSYQLTSGFSLQLNFTKGLSKFIEPVHRGIPTLTSYSTGLSVSYAF